MERNYLEIYEEFWKSIVENEDGTLNLDQIKKELSDFYFIMEQASMVYEEVTNGRISKPNTYAFEVIRLFNEEYLRPSDIFYGEDLEEIIDDDISFKEYVLDTFINLLVKDVRDDYDKEKILEKVYELKKQEEVQD